MTSDAEGVDRSTLEERGWSSDVDERRARRPKQNIEPEDHEGGGGIVLTPSWYYGCVECGFKRRLATEDTYAFEYCEDCEEHQRFEPLGELVYPGDDEDQEVRTDGGTDAEGADRDTVYVDEMPNHIYGNTLIDGPDGQCTRYYGGIDERCPNEAVAHTYTSTGKIVEMCAECCPVDIPTPSEMEQGELVTDGGTDAEGTPPEQIWGVGDRDLAQNLSEFYGVEGLRVDAGHYDEEEDEQLYEVLLYFDGDDYHVIADDLATMGHSPSGAVGVQVDSLPAQDDVKAVIEEVTA